MQCVCGGRNPGCPECKGAGIVRIEACPKTLVSSDVWALCQLSDTMEMAHALPVAGGILDQTHSFNHALTFLRADEAQFRDDLTQQNDNHHGL